MIKLPFGVEINDLIDNLRSLSWEAADILLYYSNSIKKLEQKIEILKNKNKQELKDNVKIIFLSIKDI